MKPENREWLEANKGHWELFRNDKVMRNGFDGDRALQIMREEFAPNYLCCTWCKEDLSHLIRLLYTNYEKSFSSSLKIIKEEI